MEGYQERVVQEKRELDEKVVKLFAFTCTEKWKALSVAEQVRMAAQSRIMGEYSEVLGERILAFQGEDTCEDS